VVFEAAGIFDRGNGRHELLQLRDRGGGGASLGRPSEPGFRMRQRMTEHVAEYLKAEYDRRIRRHAFYEDLGYGGKQVVLFSRIPPMPSTGQQSRMRGRVPPGGSKASAAKSRRRVETSATASVQRACYASRAPTSVHAVKKRQICVVSRT
jgi:hypothetical protein